MTVEITLPEAWPPALALAVAKMMQQSLKEGFPIIIPVRRDATPDQIWGAFEKVRMVIEDSGLAV